MLRFSTSEYRLPVWVRSCHKYKIDSTLKAARVATTCNSAIKVFLHERLSTFTSFTCLPYARETLDKVYDTFNEKVGTKPYLFIGRFFLSTTNGISSA